MTHSQLIDYARHWTAMSKAHSSSGSSLCFISMITIAFKLKDICDDKYSNKLWDIVLQDMMVVVWHQTSQKNNSTVCLFCSGSSECWNEVLMFAY
jgi:hypothetical protein